MKKVFNSAPALLEMLFENRNKAYGAYPIRLGYESRLRNSLLIALAIASLLVFTFVMLNRIVPNAIEDLHGGIIDPAKQVIVLTDPRLFRLPVYDEPVVTNVVPRVVAHINVHRQEKTRLALHPMNLDPGNATGTSSSMGTGDGKPGIAIADALPVILPPDLPIKMEEADVLPQFPGGDAKLMKYLKSRLHFTESAIAANAEGKVYVQFIVNADGKINDVHLVKGIGFGLDDEAIQTVAAMPDWKPGMKAGKAIPVYVRLPIRFSMMHEH